MQVMILLFSMYMFTVILSFSITESWVYLPLTVLCIVSIFFAKTFHLKWHISFYMILIIIITFIVIRICRNMLASFKRDVNVIVKKKKAVISILANENKVKNAKRHVLYERSRNIGNLYENIKTVSVLLRKREIVQEFCKFLNKNFSFALCRVVFFDPETEEGNAYVYTIKKDDMQVNFQERKASAFSTVIKRLKHRKTFLSLSCSDAGFSDFVEDENVSTVGVIPFYIEKKMTSIVYVFDLHPKQKDNFFIVSSQAAMSLNRSNLYERVEHLSFTDSLTGIYLRRYFDQRAKEELERAAHLKLTLAILMIDIDHFKECNDTYGHMVGDVVLKEVAARIQHAIREVDLVSRYGGEEFTVLLPDVNKDFVFQVAERIRKAVDEKDIVAYDEKVHVSVSIGASLYPKEGSSIATLINKADAAMYCSKSTGRNKVTIN